MQPSVDEKVRAAVRRLRLRKGWSVRRLAERSGLPAGSCRALERGEHRMHLEQLFRLLAALGAGIEEVWPERQSAPEPELSMDDILEAVGRVYGMAKADFARRRGRGRVAEARRMAALLAIERLELPRRVIARKTGLRPAGFGPELRRLRRRLENDSQARKYYGKCVEELSGAGGFRKD